MVTHSITRTNAKGIAFRGTCISCGAKDLPMEAAGWDCPNTKRHTQEAALLEVISK